MLQRDADCVDVQGIRMIETMNQNEHMKLLQVPTRPTSIIQYP